MRYQLALTFLVWSAFTAVGSAQEPDPSPNAQTTTAYASLRDGVLAGRQAPIGALVHVEMPQESGSDPGQQVVLGGGLRQSPSRQNVDEVPPVTRPAVAEAPPRALIPGQTGRTVQPRPAPPAFGIHPTPNRASVTVTLAPLDTQIRPSSQSTLRHERSGRE